MLCAEAGSFSSGLLHDPSSGQDLLVSRSEGGWRLDDFGGLLDPVVFSSMGILHAIELGEFRNACHDFD